MENQFPEEKKNVDSRITEKINPHSRFAEQKYPFTRHGKRIGNPLCTSARSAWLTAGESSVSILIDPIITALKPSTANTQQTPTHNIENVTESRTMKTWLIVSRNLHCRLWVLKYTRRSDLLVYTLDRSGFPNVNLGNLKWLDFWKRD